MNEWEATAARIMGNMDPAEMERRQAAALAESRKDRSIHLNRQMEKFPAREREAADRLSRRHRAESRSVAMKWLLSALDSPEWAAGELCLMTGPKGCGKTVAACVAARMMAHGGKTVRYLKAYRGDLLNDKDKEGHRINWDDFESAALVVIDEVHRLREVGPWVQVAVKGLVDVRYDARRNTIIMGTVPREEMVSLLGPEIVDRVIPRLRWEAPKGETSRRWTEPDPTESDPKDAAEDREDEERLIAESKAEEDRRRIQAIEDQKKWDAMERWQQEYPEGDYVRPGASKPVHVAPGAGSREP